MRKIIALLSAILVNVLLHAQSPDAFKYQAIVRNASGEIIANQSVSFRISIVGGSIMGDPVYTETHSVITNQFGLVNLEIGNGATSDNFSSINWGNNTFFIKIEFDISGGINYELMGTSQLLSVPYAIHAKTADSFNSEIVESDPFFSKSVASGISAYDTARWSNKLDSIIEIDPIFNMSLASGITQKDTASWNSKSNFSGSYNDLTNTPTIPKAVSELINDANYINQDTTLNEEEVDAYVSNNGYLTKEVDGDTVNEIQSLSDVIAIDNNANGQIKNLSNPTEAQDATTKAYVDEIKKTIYHELLDAGLNGILKDVEGNYYKTIKIGNQVWMVENLKTNKYKDGTIIPHVVDSVIWSNSSTIGYCWYNNDISYKNAYGALYNWNTVNSGNLCPNGWHVPSDDEWSELVNYLGGDSIAGAKLKETGDLHWDNPNDVATNISGFTALPGGTRNVSGLFYDLRFAGNWWSSTAIDNSNALYRSMDSEFQSVITKSIGLKKQGFSVRCIEDKENEDSINIGSIGVSKWYNNYNFAIAMNWDDSNPTHYTDVAPLFESYDFRTTFCIITAKNYSFTFPLYKELAERGHEIGSHTVSHINLSIADSSKIAYELRQSKYDIIQNIGVIPVTFSQPFATFSTDYNYLIYNYYLFAKRDDIGRDPDAIYYNVLSSTTYDKLKSKSQLASQDSTLIIYICHSVDSSGWEPIPKKELALFLKYVKNETNAWLTTLKDIGIYYRVRNNVSVSYTNNVVTIDDSKIDYNKYISFEINRIPLTIIISSDMRLKFIGENILETKLIENKYIVTIDLFRGNAFKVSIEKN